MSSESPDLRAIDFHIRQHASRARSNRETAEHFTLLAQEEESQLAYWTEQKQKALGTTAVDNVIAFPLERRREAE